MQSLLLFMITLVCQSDCSFVKRDTAEKECQESELQAMQNDFNNCANDLTYKFESEREGDSQEEALCNLITETVKCGTIWERCQSDEEVRRLKDT